MRGSHIRDVSLWYLAVPFARYKRFVATELERFAGESGDEVSDAVPFSGKFEWREWWWLVHSYTNCVRTTYLVWPVAKPYYYVTSRVVYLRTKHLTRNDLSSSTSARGRKFLALPALAIVEVAGLYYLQAASKTRSVPGWIVPARSSPTILPLPVTAPR